MAIYTRVNQNFPIPPDFWIESTDIRRSKTEPHLGYLEPRKGVVYSFYLFSSKEGYRLYHGTADEAEAFLIANPKLRICFVSRKISKPAGLLGWTSFDNYRYDMRKAW